MSCISEGWGGRTSDKYLTENCSLLNHLVPGDMILADRGFDIADSIGFYCSMLKIPAFTKSKKQLSSVEVEQTRKIANVCMSSVSLATSDRNIPSKFNTTYYFCKIK